MVNPFLKILENTNEDVPRTVARGCASITEDITFVYIVGLINQSMHGREWHYTENFVIILTFL